MISVSCRSTTDAAATAPPSRTVGAERFPRLMRDAQVRATAPRSVGCEKEFPGLLSATALRRIGLAGIQRPASTLAASTSDHVPLHGPILAARHSLCVVQIDDPIPATHTSAGLYLFYLTVKFVGAGSPVVEPLPPVAELLPALKAASRVAKFTPGSVPSDARPLKGEAGARA